MVVDVSASQAITWRNYSKISLIFPTYTTNAILLTLGEKLGGECKMFDRGYAVLFASVNFVFFGFTYSQRRSEENISIIAAYQWKEES
jgi:hypothetical protein